MAEQPSELRRLSDTEFGALHSGLKLAEQLAGVEGPLTTSDVQALYDAALDRGESEAELEIAIGLAFGALFVDGAEFEWARISDQWGDETCVAVVGKMVHAAPISMIQKRLHRGEQVSIAELWDGVTRVLREQAAKSANRYD